MTTGNDWRWTVTAAAVVLGSYGLVFLVVPELYIAQANFRTPPRPGVFRFQGGVLLALAIGSWLARGRAEENGPIVTVGAIASTLVPLALTYTYFFDGYDGNGRSLFFAVVVWSVFAALYWKLVAEYRAVLF